MAPQFWIEMQDQDFYHFLIIFSHYNKPEKSENNLALPGSNPTHLLGKQQLYPIHGGQMVLREISEGFLSL